MHAFEHSLEAINAVIAVLILYLGLRAAPRLSLFFQRRAALLFLAAIVLFASSELLAVIGLVGVLGDVELFRELAETGFLACLGIGLYMLRESERQEVTTLRRWADIDALTTLHNHAYFRRAADRRFEQAGKYDLPLSLIMLDIDDFKAYNDKFGHQAANVLLSLIAQILRESVRGDDIVARYGGEEFVVAVTDTLEHAIHIAERIRVNVESQCTRAHNPLVRRPVTVSLGVASLTHEIGSMEALIEATDRQMYRAKGAGKNRVTAGNTP